MAAAGGRGSDASGAAEADGHLATVVDDDGDGAAAVGQREHALELRGVFLDVDVLERHVPPFMILPGGLCVGSGVLAEDVDHPSIVRRTSDRLRKYIGSQHLPAQIGWRRAAAAALTTESYGSSRILHVGIGMTVASSSAHDRTLAVRAH